MWTAQRFHTDELLTETTGDEMTYSPFFWKIERGHIVRTLKDEHVGKTNAQQVLRIPITNDMLLRIFSQLDEEVWEARAALVEQQAKYDCMKDHIKAALGS